MEQHAFASPGQPIAESLRGLFATLLDIAPTAVGGDDDFFELGGDSLMVIKLVARIRRGLNVQVVPGEVFDHPTVNSLAAFLERG